jgi:hypothetical protein
MVIFLRLLEAGNPASSSPNGDTALQFGLSGREGRLVAREHSSFPNLGRTSSSHPFWIWFQTRVGRDFQKHIAPPVKGRQGNVPYHPLTDRHSHFRKRAAEVQRPPVHNQTARPYVISVKVPAALARLSSFKARFLFARISASKAVVSERVQSIQRKMEMDWLGIAGLVGTFGFGIVSLYQRTALSAIRGAIRSHSQSTFNHYWSIGADTSFVSKAVMDNPQALDSHMVVGRCRAADAASVAGRTDVINFAREYADFVPFRELAWEPKPQLLKEKGSVKKIFSTLSGK